VRVYYFGGLGAWPQDNLGHFSGLLRIKLSSYFKFSKNIITNSVWIGDCFIRIRDCSIRVFDLLLLIMEVEEG